MHPMRFATYRDSLLQAIETILRDPEAAESQVPALLKDLPRPTHFSINSLIWQHTISSLRDSMLRREATEFWLNEQVIFTGASSDLQRVYICYDFRRVMSEEDRACLEALHSLCQFLEGFPFAAPGEALEEHAQKEQAALEALRALPRPADIGDELVYRWILREVGTALAPVALKPSLVRLHYLIPQPPFDSLQVGGFAHTFPNVGRLLGGASGHSEH
jgi:hypothetical protein